MSFYGNVANGNKTQLTFDKIYPNLSTMLKSCYDGDSVFIGRYVLVEYDDNQNPRRLGYSPNKIENNKYTIYLDSSKVYAYKHGPGSVDEGYGLSVGDIVFVIKEDSSFDFYTCSNEIADDGSAIFNFVLTSKRDVSASADAVTQSRIAAKDYTLNFNIDKEFFANSDNYKYVSLLGDSLFDERGYDSTVWMKSVEHGKETYKNIARLNSETPTFEVVEYAPTLNPIAPHFDTNGTNLNYGLRLQPNWGVRVKEVPVREEDFAKKAYDIENANEFAALQNRGTIFYKEGESYIPIEEYNESISIYYTNDETAEQYIYRKNLPTDSKVTYVMVDDPTTPDDETSSKEYYGAIYFNEKGFDWNKINYSGKNAEISLLPTGKSGKKYLVSIDENGQKVYQEKEDILELTLSIPQIGNTMAHVWDIVYGDTSMADKKGNRNTLISWGDLDTGLRLVHFNTITGGYDFTIEEVSTIAGAINSTQDLIGKNVVYDGKNSLEEANPNSIYFGDYLEKERYSFFFKDITYDYEAIDKSEMANVRNSREWFTLEEYAPNKYHIKKGLNFYFQTGAYVPNTQYYEITAKNLNLRPWEQYEEDELTGEVTKLDFYYKDQNLNYILDTSDEPDLDKTYYTIVPTQQTYPIADNVNQRTEIWRATNPILQDIDESTGRKWYSGYAYVKEHPTDSTQDYIALVYDGTVDQDGNQNPATIFDPNETYYYLDKFTWIPGSDTDGAVLVLSLDGKQALPVRRIIDGQGNAVLGIQDYPGLIVKMIEFSPDVYYKQTAYGYACIHSLNEVQNDIIYYTINATPKNGEQVPVIDGNGNDTGEKSDIYFYKPGVYYLKTLTGDYILSMGEFDPKIEYVSLNGVDEAVQTKFYEPGEYYYYSKQHQINILDYSGKMKTPTDPDVGMTDEGRVYFHPVEVYVKNDSDGILPIGAIWSANDAPPDSVTLAKRIEVPKWTELLELAKGYNTIHGLILRFNQFCKFDDDLTRDRKTLQGTLNYLNDYVNKFGQFNKTSLVVTDSYTRMKTANVTTDSWIDFTFTDGLNTSTLDFKHSNPQVAKSTIGQNSDKTLNFGESFTTSLFKIDGKGHVLADAKNTSITLPTLSIDSSAEGNVIIGMEVAQSGKFTLNKAYVGALALTGYVLGSSSELISSTDTINIAFGKVQNQLNKVLGAEPNVQSNWTETDSTSDAFILNKPTNLITTDSTFAYGDSSKTIAEMYNHVAELETKINKVENAEANVQADWTEDNNTSDAFILNKPTNLVTTASTFAYGDSAKTIAEMYTYIAQLETRIKALEDSGTTTA